MATKTILVDDLDGTEADVTIAFSIDGETYSLDLSTENADRFWKDLGPYVQAAGSLRRKQLSVVQQELDGLEMRQAIRAWAREQGYEISDRGRIPEAVIEAYNETRKK